MAADGATMEGWVAQPIWRPTSLTNSSIRAAAPSAFSRWRAISASLLSCYEK